MLLLILQVLCAAAVCVFCSSQRVFSGCGARLNVVNVPGLILSPGFPGHYSSGMHCVWQFFVPAGRRLKLEMLDFDIFESSERNVTVSGDTIRSEEGGGEGEDPLGGTSGIGEGAEGESWNTRSPLWEKTHTSAFPTSPEPEAPPGISSSVSEDEAETLLLVKDTCPDDVVYITDLMAFSARFCGSTRPSDGRLVFGSDAEMVEVIMELITNTHRGRGFALIFRYHNSTSEAGVQVVGQRSSEASVGTEVLLAVVLLAALFATSLTIILCVSLRTKLCAKDSSVTSITPEAPVQNLQTDASELQLVTANHPEQKHNINNNETTPHTGNIPEYRSCKTADLESTNGLMEMELGADEVFVISDTPSITPCTHRERFLQCSDGGSVQTSDWMPCSEPPGWPSRGGHAGPSRSRAWSVRTFHDRLLPFPQLNRKWCSWNLTSPFSKLVDSVSPGSVMDGPDAVKVPQHQQRYDASHSHTSQQICEPDGALSGLENGVEIKICEIPPAAAAAAADYDDYNLSVPVFGVSEDDREPLVSSEPCRVKNDEIGKRQSFLSLGSAHFPDEESSVLKNSRDPLSFRESCDHVM